ncbi:MAG: response regulator [Trichloromonas sp.]|jgi:DNA-binding NtrC family response regulator|nr:response regulator [Trichloromonas sp.]
MRTLLIADQDSASREEMRKLMAAEGYQIRMANSVVEVLRDALKNQAQVLLLGMEFENMLAVELIPLVKKCSKDLMIILVSDEDSLPLLRKVRGEGIFYHALRPVTAEDKEELRLAVRCAFEKYPQVPSTQSQRLQRLEAMA